MSGQVITRRNLPHWYVPGAVHFVTYRLADTIPGRVLDDLRGQFQSEYAKAHDAAGRVLAHKRHFSRYDGQLDAGRGNSWLRSAPVAALVRGNLYHHEGRLYHLIAFCVMPNHVHVLFQPIEATQSGRAVDSEAGERPDAKGPLARIMHALKSYTAHEANKVLGRSGAFWQSESYDHWVRDDRELANIVAYIVANPVKAGLVSRGIDWHFGSALDRYVRDGNEEGWLLPPLPAEEVILGREAEPRS